MNKQIIVDVLADVYPGRVELAPHLAEEAAAHAVERKETEIATSDFGDTFITAETMDILIQASVFVAAIVATAKDLKHLFSSKGEKERTKKLVIENEIRLNDLSDEEADKLLAALEKRLSKPD